MNINKILSDWLNLFLGRPVFLLGTLSTSVAVFFWIIWSGGFSLGGVMAGGALQVSDAQGYWMCANSIVDYGTIDEWCMRRPLYDVLLSGIVRLADHNIFSVLIIQSVLVVSAIHLFSLAAASLVGRLGTWLVALLIFSYAAFHALPVTMSENAGLILGCLAYSFLLIGVDRKKPILLVLGSGLISLGLAARPGALFLLPALIIFSVWYSYISYGKVKSWVALFIISMLIGFIAQVFFVDYFGGNPQSSSSNFSYTIYGLSLGGMGWNQALVDFPNYVGREYEFAQFLYQKSIENIALDPLKLIHGLYTNAKYTFENGTLGYVNFGAFKKVVKYLWVIGWIPILLRLKTPGYLLLGLSSLSIYFSAMIIYMDGGSRLFAVTAPVDALQVVVGFIWVVQTFSAILSKYIQGIKCLQVKLTSENSFLDVRFYLVILTVILFLCVFGLLGSSGVSTAQSVARKYCGVQEHQILTYIGGSRSLLLDLTDNDNDIDSMRGKVSRDIFLSRISAGMWWRDELISFQGKSLLLGYQLDSHNKFSPNYEGGVPMLYSDKSISDYYGQKVAVCVDPIKYLKIFGAPYFRINSIHRLDGSD